MPSLQQRIHIHSPGWLPTISTFHPMGKRKGTGEGEAPSLLSYGHDLEALLRPHWPKPSHTLRGSSLPSLATGKEGTMGIRHQPDLYCLLLLRTLVIVFVGLSNNAL